MPLFRQYRGTLEESLKTVRHFDFKEDLVSYLNKSWEFFLKGKKLNEDDLIMERYSKDERIGWNNHLLSFKVPGKDEKWVAGFLSEDFLVSSPSPSFQKGDVVYSKTHTIFQLGRIRKIYLSGCGWVCDWIYFSSRLSNFYQKPTWDWILSYPLNQLATASSLLCEDCTVDFNSIGKNKTNLCKKCLATLREVAEEGEQEFLYSEKVFSY